MLRHFEMECIPIQRVIRSAPVTVLLVEANVDVARMAEKALLSAGEGAIKVECLTNLAQAFERLALGDIEVVLAAECLPDCAAPKVLERLRMVAPEALVLPLTDVDTQSDSTGSDGLESGISVLDMNWLPGALLYVTRRKTTEAAWQAADEALFAEQERARVTCGSIADAVLITDIQGKVAFLNKVAQELTGWPGATALGKPLLSVFKITDRETGEIAKNPAIYAMTENIAVAPSTNSMLCRYDGTEVGIEDSAAPLHDRYGAVTGAVIVFRDISQSLVMTRKMAWLASHDSLTGLASRMLFEERFRQVASLANRQGKQAALLFVDLDNFKQTNDLFGHRVGDHVLQAVARTLLRGVRDTDTVCRYGGDEFVILLADVSDLAAAELAANKLLSLFARALQVDEHRVKVSMSIGISMYPNDGREMQALIERADIAMYQAKASGKNACGIEGAIRPANVL
ncbi:diguanylate cyclase [Salinispirillum sp. LH 10-3-1]|uniref:Diguanylate cyclase n=1 Tax=Salinispirillum sp. LH 10-3-1 TaxID=2952525 RepID=A0AB38YBS2_9GAMM